MPEPSPVLPEVLIQIQALPRSGKPLIICDVDEVVLHLIKPLETYLEERGLGFFNHSYRFTGNIGPLESREPLSADAVRRILQSFFDDVSAEQELVACADLALAKLAPDWDIVLLTNLPGGHNKGTRETHLARLGVPYPVVTNSGPKGGAAAALAAGRSAPVVFIDDSPNNHVSVHASLPSATQIQFIADARFRANVEPDTHIDLLSGDWMETAAYVGTILET